MSDSPDENETLIARLLNELADLSGDEDALRAYRREADLFDPALSAAGIALELLAVEKDPECRKDVRGFLERLLEVLRARGENSSADGIAGGLRKFGGAGPRP